jgi:hypothetical protein
MTDRELIHLKIDEELDRMEFERSLKQKWFGKVAIDIHYENGEISAIFKDREREIIRQKK